MMAEERQIITVKEQKKLLYMFYGFIAGIIVFWFAAGSQGENAGWLMLFSVIGFVYYTRTRKKQVMTFIDAINIIAEEYRRNGVFLDTDPYNIRVYRKRDGEYVFDFRSNGISVTWEGTLARGIQEVSDRSAESLRYEKENKDVELRRVVEKALEE